ncbi:MAG: hypothetical protein JNL57_02490 [Bacteroidetes bacterium]|nr:hypothetical protein [Bacteroidota bacterium]
MKRVIWFQRIYIFLLFPILFLFMRIFHGDFIWVWIWIGSLSLLMRMGTYMFLSFAFKKQQIEIIKKKEDTLKMFAIFNVLILGIFAWLIFSQMQSVGLSIFFIFSCVLALQFIVEYRFKKYRDIYILDENKLYFNVNSSTFSLPFSRIQSVKTDAENKMLFLADRKGESHRVRVRSSKDLENFRVWIEQHTLRAPDFS